ncbi:MAG: DUF190 domain-containing protein [Desulfonauticus sp.]|nr:DUF190 domain-containing protein [Desulfonauticus sp.]
MKQLLKIYLGENDQLPNGMPVYEKIVSLAREQNLLGATVYRGIMGFGANSYIHSTKILRLSEDLPIVIDIIDDQEKIAKFVQKIKIFFQQGTIVTINLEDTLHFPLLVKDVMISNPVTISYKSLVSDALSLMSYKKVKFLPVIDIDKKLKGVLTGRDILNLISVAINFNLKNKDISNVIKKEIPQDIRVEEVMTKEVVTIGPQSTINECTKILHKNKIKRLPVVDEENKLVGVISKTDILFYFTNIKPHTDNISSIKGVYAKDLACEVPIVELDTSVDKIITTILEHPLQMAVCVDDAQKACGLIFDSDLINYFFSKNKMDSVGLWDRIKEFFVKEKDISLESLIHKKFYFVEPEDDVHTIIQKMKEYNVKRLPVLTKKRLVLGVVERDALLSYLFG